MEIYDGDSVLIVKVNSNESWENEQRSGNYENKWMKRRVSS